jgi:hypothetical protein
MIIATVLLILTFGCAIFLTVDWVIDELKRDKNNKRELQSWLNEGEEHPDTYDK